MLAITGATGRLGGKVASRLANLGIAQRLIVRDPSRAPQLPNAEIMQSSSYGDAVAMGRALRGVDTLFLVSARDRFGIGQNANDPKAALQYDRAQQQITAVDAAAAVGVKHIIYLSVINAAADATFILSHDHFRTEEHIRGLGIAFTFLRMNLYTDHVPFYISDDGVIRAPAGEGRASWVTRDDLADVAVAVLTGSGHDGCTYDVTGPEALTMAETAKCLSDAMGREITYQPQTPHEARTLHTTSGFDKLEAMRYKLTGRGFTDYDTEVLVTHFMQIATGELSIVSDTVPKLTGHRAQSLSEYLEKHPESYQKPPLARGF
jgi:NAD(P)H dehydrogenase (quinone)